MQAQRNAATVDWSKRATNLLQEALDGLAEGNDVIPEVTEALAALYLASGETPHTVVVDTVGYAEAESELELECACPPGLVERGGFSSRCPVHGSGLLPLGNPEVTG